MVPGLSAVSQHAMLVWCKQIWGLSMQVACR